jgi:hypothetical protein
MKTGNRKSWFKTLPFIIILIYGVLPLSAQEQAQDSLVNEQVKYLQEMLDHDVKNAQIWWYSWLAGYSVATVGQGVVYFSSDNLKTRQDMALGSATTLLGALGQIIAPMPHPSSSSGNRENVEDDSARISSLQYSEDMLKALARREKEGRSWKTHALFDAINIGSGLITWLGFKRTFMDGLENFAMNTVISEAQIWTQPTRAIKDYERYCRQYGTSINPAACKPEKKWLLYAGPGVITVKLVF